ncbi:related to Leucine Rich Repeat domain protein [Rhynchosporium agropyri]|uniref:Related to Leucine Rich Repeat domain protein n=1 Tax=Rhynchosporium agropyri TaxID=914238 RepID=A0A1E1L7U5_9HELO|nr:related to Leucine Rich Repeat domain protein [Rhynchosporium agropyri]
MAVTPNSVGRKVVPPLPYMPEKKNAPISDSVDRASFSSTKESHMGGIAQTFTETKTSSYLRNEYIQDEDAILDDSSSGSATPPELVRPDSGRGMLTNPHSNLHGFVCPCDGFKGWKDISVRGRIASRSSGDLKGLARWDWDLKADENVKMTGTTLKDNGKNPAGKSPFESLPVELLGAIIDQLATDIPPGGFTARNIDLMSLLLTSRGIHSATLSTLYAQVTIPHSRIFRKFLSHISAHPALGTIVRRLDFSHFNPTGAGMSARERAQTQNLIPETLLQALLLTTNLQEFLAQEHIDDELSPGVLKTLLCDLPKLKALDFCACSSTSFRESFNAIINSQMLPSTLPIARLSLHECTILPSSVFDSILPRLTRLTHLDVAHTRITDSALHSIPHTARLTHLNLSKCSHLSGASVVNFLNTHPAAKELIYLNLAMDAKSSEMLTSADLTALIPCLPTTLRSLNLKGSKMGKEHIELLLPLTKHAEELGLGRHLDLCELTRLFVPDCDLSIAEQIAWIPHSLRYIDVSDLSVAQLDLSTLFGSSCPVLKSMTEPLEVLELSAEVLKMLEKAPAVKRAGWCIKEAGRRGWLVRLPREGGVKDEGARSWKWGATYWGMRKVPVARAEVGGIYGHYMFKKN